MKTVFSNYSCRRRYALLALLSLLPFCTFAHPLSAQKKPSAPKISSELVQYSPVQHPEWEIHLEKIGNPAQKDTLRSMEQSEPQESAIQGGLRLSYLHIPGIRLTLDITSKGEQALCIQPRIQNFRTGWVITSFYGPVVQNIKADLTNFPLCMPVGLGQIYRKLPTSKDPLDVLPQKGATPWKWIAGKHRYELISSEELGAPSYPSRFATMQWCAFSGKSGGLYLASHDSTFSSKRFRVFYSPDAQQNTAIPGGSMGFAFEHYFTCFPNTSVQLPALVVRSYRGSWHEAAHTYRAWYDTRMQARHIPDWLQQSSGWFLTILKQQNNQIMWNYADVGTRMAEYAQSRGLDIVGWFGWTLGGHDRFYPDYVPDPQMGGEKALMAAIGQLHQKNIRSVLYANGQLIDQDGTDYWGEVGKDITVVQENGKLYAQTWHKYNDAPARHHGMACLATPAWYNRMLSLALQANRLGADGIIYDQLGVTAPCLCYATNHGHSTPAVVYEKDRYALLKRIADTMTSINPKFIVMTEGLCDVELNSVSLFHGYCNGVYVPSQSQLTEYVHQTAATSIFPEMFSYTFPEKKITVRNPSPVNNRLTLNYSTAYGLRNELESRYQADVRYLAENRVPVPSDYSNVISKPNLDLVTGEDPVAMKAYIKAVIDFQRKYERFLWNGTFTDDLGVCRSPNSSAFSLAADSAVIAKSFVRGNETALLLWNTCDTQSHPFEVKAKPGFRLTEVASPEHREMDCGLPASERVIGHILKPQSLILLVFTKK